MSKWNVGNNKEGTITNKNNKTLCYLVIRFHFSPGSSIDRSNPRSRNSLDLLPLPLGISHIVTVEPPAPHLHELHEYNTRQMTIINYSYQPTVESHKRLQELTRGDEVLIRVHPKQGFKYRISRSYRMGFFISNIGYRGRYRRYTHISVVHSRHYI